MTVALEVTVTLCKIPLMEISIEPMQTAETAVCEQILRALPNWFGIEESIVEYVQDMGRMETAVAKHNDTIVGFITIHIHFPQSAEIHVMGILPAYHRQGVGKMLVQHVEATLAQRGVQFIQVKTLAPSHPDPSYAKTRQFYKSIGFVPLEENQLWGEANPCLIMIKTIP